MTHIIWLILFESHNVTAVVSIEHVCVYEIPITNQQMILLYLYSSSEREFSLLSKTVRMDFGNLGTKIPFFEGFIWLVLFQIGRWKSPSIVFGLISIGWHPSHVISSWHVWPLTTWFDLMWFGHSTDKWRWISVFSRSSFRLASAFMLWIN